MKHLIFWIALVAPFLLSSQSRPNIVLIISDDQGYGEFGFNTSNYTGATPMIDTLKTNGVYFPRFYVHPACTPSRAELLTGRYSFRYGLQEQVVRGYSDQAIPVLEKTLPEYLKEYGYQTAIIGKWHLGHVKPEYLPYNHGFDYFFGNAAGQIDYYDFDFNNDGIDVQENGTGYAPDGKYYTTLLGEKAVEWIGEQAQDTSKPFFLYVPFTAPHDVLGTFTAQYPADSLANAPAGLTTAGKQKWVMIRMMDYAIESIYDKLESEGILDNTIIIFFSDNGAINATESDNGSLRGYKGGLYEGGIRTHLIWYHRNTINAGQVDSMAHAPDILPTIIQGVLSGETTRTTDGQNIYPLITGTGTIPSRRLIRSYVPGRMWAVIGSKYKVVNNAGVDFASGSLSENIEVFDLLSDISEGTDIAGSNPALIADYKSYLETFNNDTVPQQTITETKPGGWVNISYWALPEIFYDSTYFYFRPY